VPYSNLPSFVVSVNVKLNSVNQANVQVTLRNERTNNSSNLTTDSNGDVVFDAANIEGGVAVSDVLTAFCFYTNYESSSQITVTEGGTQVNLSLSAVPSSDTLRYFTVQKFYETFSYPLNDNNTELIKSIDIVRVGTMMENQIDEELNSKFDSNSGNYYSQTEYLDTNEKSDVYFLNKTPVISITSLQTTQSSENSAPDISTGSWNTLTNGTNFKVDLDTGRVFVITEQYKPITRRNGLYVSYKYGRTSVPSEITRLTLLMTMEHFAMGNIMKNLAMGRKTNISGNDLDLINKEIQRIKDYYMNWHTYPSP